MSTPSKSRACEFDPLLSLTCPLQWLLMRQHVLDADEVVVMSGDYVVVTKAGKATYGLDRFFASLYGKAVPGLCFLSLSLLSVKRRTSYPVVTEQVEKAGEATAQAQPTKTSSGPRGRPKGSKNRHRREVELRPSLRFLQEHIKRLTFPYHDFSEYACGLAADTT